MTTPEWTDADHRAGLERILADPLLGAIAALDTARDAIARAKEAVMREIVHQQAQQGPVKPHASCAECGDPITQTPSGWVHCVTPIGHGHYPVPS